MQRAKKTPNANLIINKIDKCSQQCTLSNGSTDVEQHQTTNCRTTVVEETISSDCKNNIYKKEISLELNEKEELNNNLVERKNANNRKTTIVNRWSNLSAKDEVGTNNISAFTAEISTPIYLHNQPSFNLMKSEEVLKYQKNENLPVYQTNQIKQMNSMKPRVNSDQNNDRQQINHLQLLHCESNQQQMQLHQINIAEQRMEERKLKHRSKLASRLSSDSSSTGSSDEDERLNKDLPYPEFVRYSFNWFPQDSELRLICLKMVANPWFERISMTAILLNCITLGMYHPCADEICLRPKCKMLQMFDDVIFAFFALEMFIK